MIKRARTARASSSRGLRPRVYPDRVDRIQVGAPRCVVVAVMAEVAEQVKSEAGTGWLASSAVVLVREDRDRR